MNAYANITLKAAEPAAVVDHLNRAGQVAYVVGAGHGVVVIFHAELSQQETIAAELSGQFACPALAVMGYAGRVLIYQLYESGQLTDAYVSETHEDLDDGGEPPPGDADRLCDAFSRASAMRRVKTVLGKSVSEGNGYALAQNRHGELLAALGLPTWAAGIGFASIEIGEMPAGEGFEAGSMIRTR